MVALQVAWALIGIDRRGGSLIKMAHLEHPTTNPDLIQYIYCVKLPFNCGPNSSFRSALNLEIPRRRNIGYHPYRRPFGISRHPPNSLVALPPTSISMALMDIMKPRWVVVKVGISKDPARRLHEIFDVFEKLDGVQTQMYLGDISPTDSPEVCIRKAKSLDSIVFIQKVQDIGTAEGDVRMWLGRPLGEDFIDKFTSHVTGLSLSRDGMTEWIVADYELVIDLRNKFCRGQLYRADSYTQAVNTLAEVATGQPFIYTARGNVFFHQFCAHCFQNFRRYSRPRSEVVVIQFEPTKFRYELSFTR